MFDHFDNLINNILVKRTFQMTYCEFSNAKLRKTVLLYYMYIVSITIRGKQFSDKLFILPFYPILKVKLQNRVMKYPPFPNPF